MFFKTVFFTLFSSALLYAGQSVVAHDRDYFTKDVQNTKIIFTKENEPFAKDVAILEQNLQSLYEQMFGWRFDEKLSVGLVSDYNQIANGFSSQFPNNRQINYIGGTTLIDKFASTSWLETLIYHESAHNYQLNVKNNSFSKNSHTLFRNCSLF